MRTQIGRWGNSLAVRLPGAYVKDLGLSEGTELEISAVGGGLLLRPAKREYSLEELVAQITEENRHGETDWGQAVGREAW
jgi:antitoxin MazE